ncbi:MAG TPA: response regulator transcription factor [Candidatus Saccharimonadales bacterium]|jgi:DNA-binding response OmpR family regulator|nr:response regulator transcription factor [Candidatus Saccharimonadales bacterium]
MRILLVEDEHKIANAVKEGLSEESFAVDISYDGQEGLNAAEYEDYDLVILDRMLPGGMDGVEICRRLRNAGKHTPVLMLTAKDQVRDRVEGLNAGADDYLVKPFSFEELLARVKALLRRPHDALGEALTVGDLMLDTVSKAVTRAGKPVTLSTKEYALLEYLMRNQGKVLSKNNIMTHVWDFDADILPNTVEVFITYLRAKIDKPFKAPVLIKTVRGFGYKIEASA